MSRLRKLAEIGGPAIQAAGVNTSRIRESFGDFAAEQLVAILSEKNGFYAFEGALHVFPDVAVPPELGLFEWNEAGLWRAAYRGMADQTVFFAEDAFGTQFCIRERAIGTFDPETGEFEQMASSAEDWSAEVLEDYSYWSGHPVAQAWQRRHGPVPVGSRLVPVTPFVLGGGYEAGNVRAIEAVKGMKFRASIAVEIRDLPDGGQIELQVIE